MAIALAIFTHPPAIYVRSWDVSIFIASLGTCRVSAKRPTSISPAKRQQGAPILASERGMQARWVRDDRRAAGDGCTQVHPPVQRRTVNDDVAVAADDRRYSFAANFTTSIYVRAIAPITSAAYHDTLPRTYALSPIER